MSRDEGHTRLGSVGLCATCLHRREQTSRRGSLFYRCARADENEAFLRYPPLPVLRCGGHEEDPATRQK